MKRQIPKRCERCGKEFVCGLFGCWCSDITVTEAQYANITKQYHDCLCPSCLSAVLETSLRDVSTNPSRHSD